MKPLELTQDQRGKLLEMCRKLFPEYPPHVSSFDCRECGCIDDYLQVNVNGDIIHWFEFCMTKLANRVFYETIDKCCSIDGTNYEALYMHLLQGTQHPVDYLYKQFLKED